MLTSSLVKTELKNSFRIFAIPASSVTTFLSLSFSGPMHGLLFVFLLMYAKNGRLLPPSLFASFFSNRLFAFLMRFFTFLSASLYSSVIPPPLTCLHSLFFLLMAARISLLIQQGLPRQASILRGTFFFTVASTFLLNTVHMRSTVSPCSSLFQSTLLMSSLILSQSAFLQFLTFFAGCWTLPTWTDTMSIV